MKLLTEIASIRNFRSIKDADPVGLGDVTLFVGPNNSGKSSVLQSVLLLQERFGAGRRQVRLGEPEARVILRISGLRNLKTWGEWKSTDGVITISLDSEGNTYISAESVVDPERVVSHLPAREPDHLIVPFLSYRRPELFSEDVREENAIGVYPDMRFLAAKLTRVAQPAHPRHEAYATACKSILGAVVTAIPAPNGQMPGVFVGPSDNIPLAEMGAGAAQVVGLLADLALSEGKIFVIEEPENDLHPSALRALLDLIIVAADRNQFLVSTHSSVVLRHLGSLPTTRLHHVKADLHGGWPPETVIREVPPEPAARSEILIDLGYELRDLEFFDGWLFLEESSAESIIRDHLIPWFVPDLAGRLRTVSARGVSRVVPVFHDFERLVLFTHLEERYRDRAWVIVDGDSAGTAVVDTLRKRYSTGWSADRFRTLEEEAFERYYPPLFSGRAEAVLGQPDKRRRRQMKADLLREVLAWIEANPGEAKAQFEESAAEVILLLRDIELALGLGRVAASPTRP